MHTACHDMSQCVILELSRSYQEREIDTFNHVVWQNLINAQCNWCSCFWSKCPLLSTITYTISGKYMQDGEDQSYIVMMSNSPTLQQDGGKNSSVQFLCVASNSSVSWGSTTLENLFTVGYDNLTKYYGHIRVWIFCIQTCLYTHTHPKATHIVESYIYLTG